MRASLLDQPLPDDWTQPPEGFSKAYTPPEPEPPPPPAPIIEEWGALPILPVQTFTPIVAPPPYIEPPQPMVIAPPLTFPMVQTFPTVPKTSPVTPMLLRPPTAVSAMPASLSGVDFSAVVDRVEGVPSGHQEAIAVVEVCEGSKGPGGIFPAEACQIVQIPQRLLPTGRNKEGDRLTKVEYQAALAAMKSPPQAQQDMSLLSSIAKGVGKLIPGVGTAIAAYDMYQGVKSAVARPSGTYAPTIQPPPSIPLLTGGVQTVQTMGMGSAIGKIGGAIGRTVGRAGSTAAGKWVKGVAGGVITYYLIDKLTGAILRTSDRPPSRRMNTMNVKALKRANRRLEGFANASKPIMRELGWTVKRTKCSGTSSCGCSGKKKKCG